MKRKNVATAAPAPEHESIATLEQVEKGHILSVYNLMDQNKSRTARSLGIGLNTLRRKLKAYGAA